MLISGTAEAIMQKKRVEAGRRTALALQKLSSYTVLSRKNCFYLWMLLPRGWVTGREFELTASAAGVKVFCAEKFAVGSGPVPAAVRIALTGPETIEELEKGLDIPLLALRLTKKAAPVKVKGRVSTALDSQ